MIGYDQVVLVDFDGVLHDIKHPVPGRRMGPPIVGAKEGMEKLKARGNKLIIFSVRASNESGKKVISNWMEYYGIPFVGITNIKVNADWIVDDRAIHFSSWEDPRLMV